jgi:tetratricopeptide (TPR) repeat protein
MSLGLSIITNKGAALKRVINDYGQYFDKIFVTVADKDKKLFNSLVTDYKTEDKVHLSYFKWCDDFAAARNYNLEQIDTDFWFWMDDDDTIDHPERLKDIVTFMEVNDMDVVQLKYDYAQNQRGQAISDHWRERVIRRSYEGKWDAPVHETFQGPIAMVEQLDWVVVKHKKESLDIVASMERNERILRKHWKKTHDPRDAFYLGMTELSRSRHKEAINWFLAHIQTSGSDEDKYRSWCRIAECEWMRGNYEQGLYATDEAVKLRPDMPDAYYIKIILYTIMEEFDKGIEWLKVATSKPVPKTMHMIDPTLYKYRGLAYGAQCYLFGGRIKEAFALYKEVMANDPSEDVFNKEMQQLFEDAYFDNKAIDYLKWLLYYVDMNSGKTTKLFEALPPRLFADVRLNAERTKFLPPKEWPKKSIVFYCGQSYEPWGPDTLDKGMGGSEEAVVYLSRELAKLGWEVMIYNERDEEYYDVFFDNENKGFIVTYKPWTLLNPQDKFDVFVSWRNPSFARACGIKARKLVVDLHDVPQGIGAVTNADIEKIDHFFFKSEYHKSLVPNAKDKAVVVGNGIVKEQFNG